MRRLVVLLMLPFVAAAAQTPELRGTVRDSASALPISGAVVVLLGAQGQMLGRNITNDRGEYQVGLAPAATHARFLRLGFRPRDLPIPAAVNGVATLDATMGIIPAMLEAVQVTTNPNCPRRPDEAQALALLEQARAALLASIVSQETNRASVVRYAYDRTHDGTSDRIVRMTVRVDSAANASTSFAATHSARDFVRRGFMEWGADGQVYSAPDAAVLLDSAFSNAYCFRLVTDADHARQVGLGFTAARAQERRVDVDGALWVDTSARAVTAITFDYKGVDGDVDKLKPGGSISFKQMKNGSVMIDRWNLRLIGSFVDTVMTAQSGGRAEPEERSDYTIHDLGGELAHARWPDGTTWDASMPTLQATARTRTGQPAPFTEVWFPGTPYRGVADSSGRVEIPDLVPGPYSAVIVDSSLLSIGLTIPTNLAFSAERGTMIAKSFTAKSAEEFVLDRCPADERARYAFTGATLVIARFFDVQGHPVDKVRWSAMVNSDSVDKSQHSHSTWTPLGDNAETGFDGTVQICSPMPRRGSIRIGGWHDRKTYLVERQLTSRVNVIPIVLAPSTMVADVDDPKPPAPVAATTAELAGYVFTDSTQQAIAGAEISVPELGLSALSDEKGEFHLRGIPPGEQHVQVRRIGYGSADTKLEFFAGRMAVRRFVLSPVVALQPVDVSAAGVHIPSFDEHKRVGLGHFMERADIAKYDGMKMSSVVQTMSGVDIASSHAGAYVLSRHAPPPSAGCAREKDPAKCVEGEGYYVASPNEVQNFGVPAVGCYALVYVDGMLMNGPREPTEPFDINQIPPDRAEAIEYYDGPSQTPLEYSRMGTKCGVLVIWTSSRKK